MAEIQCFDGAGVVPPEIDTLLESNDRLRTVVREQQKEIDRLNKNLETMGCELDDVVSRLLEIQTPPFQKAEKIN